MLFCPFICILTNTFIFRLLSRFLRRIPKSQRLEQVLWVFLYRISSVEFNKCFKRTFVDWNIYVHLFALRTVYIIYSCKCFMMLSTLVHFLTFVSHHPTVDFYVCLQMTNIHYSWFINKCNCTVYI